MFDLFQKEKVQESYLSVYKKDEPLVSILIATYNRAELLVNRCLRSLICQDYRNIEIIVVGDCCTDDTEQAIKNLNDDRIRFKNLPVRGNYPAEAELRWMVAGTEPVNLALKMARGDFIAHLDDDDAYMHDRIRKLVAFVQSNQADIVYHPYLWENPSGEWALNPANHFRFGFVTNSSVLYHNWFKRIPGNINAYKWKEPGDWNRFRKFKYMGAKLCRYPEPLLRHYRERSQTL